MTINIVPRHAVVKFHIVTWSVAHNLHACRQVMKVHKVCGSVTRDSFDAIFVVMKHPDMTVLEDVYKQIQAVVSVEHKGYCRDPRWAFDWGSLECCIRTHRSTAQRSGKVRSWKDDDSAQSTATCFSAPLREADPDPPLPPAQHDCVSLNEHH
jgi:hypothetical protein